MTRMQNPIQGKIGAFIFVIFGADSNTDTDVSFHQLTEVGCHLGWRGVGVEGIKVNHSLKGCTFLSGLVHYLSAVKCHH